MDLFREPAAHQAFKCEPVTGGMVANNQRGFISKCLVHVGGVHQNAALAHRNLLKQCLSLAGLPLHRSSESFFEESGLINFHDTRFNLDNWLYVARQASSILVVFQVFSEFLPQLQHASRHVNKLKAFCDFHIRKASNLLTNTCKICTGIKNAECAGRFSFYAKMKAIGKSFSPTTNAKG